LKPIAFHPAARPADLGPVWRAFATDEAGRVRLETRSDGTVFVTWLNATQAHRLASELQAAAVRLGFVLDGAATPGDGG